MSDSVEMAQSVVQRLNRRYAFIVPRFGRGIAGGAETLVGELAARLALRGDYVEVFATCARDNRTWDNYFAPGPAIEFGLPVRRFAVDARNLDSWIPKQIHISEGMNLSVEDQLEWLAEGVNSQALYEHLVKVRDNFDAFFFAPYLFGTTFWGSLINPDKSYLIPCLHNEYYAYTDVVASMFRLVAGAIFNALPEQELAQALYGRVPGGEVGMGFDLIPNEEIATLEPFFKESFPYLLYVGRKETGKNVPLLIDYFIKAKDEGQLADDVKLVVVGGGSFEDLDRPEALERDDIIDLAHVSEHDKSCLIKHARVLCQPSVNESFSIVLMEAWLLGTPVLVHARCPVTRYHVVQSGGGLFFSDEADFNAVVVELFTNPTLGTDCGAAGNAYVANTYSWEAVLDRFELVMANLLLPQSHYSI